MLIEIEGIDGVGKTTQSRLLQKWITDQGVDCIVVREPAGTKFGRRMKELIMSDVPRGRRTETFSFLAAKTQLYSEVIIPSLAKGKHVISDRGSLSYLSYHHISAGAEIPLLQNLMMFAVDGILPALTILLDVPVEIALERLRGRKRLSPFDRMGRAFFEKQRGVFLRLCNECPNCVVVDGSSDAQSVHETIRGHSSIFLR